MGIIAGSALAQLRVVPFGSDEAMIVVRSYVVTGAEMTPDLMHFLLRKNGELPFGAFGLDSDDDIVFDYTIQGLTCDKPEVRTAVMAVVQTADRFDDEIIAKWGGQRAQDRARAES
jgi:hypothetical protein